MAKAESLDVVSAVRVIFETLDRVPEEDRVRVLGAVQNLIGAAPCTPSVATIQPTSRSAVSSPTRPISLVELIKEKSPATNSQKIALFAFYRERVEGLPRFSREDIKGYFAMAKESPPGNYDRDFAGTVRQGWIHEDGSDSYLTSRGLETVEAGFGGKAAPRGRHSSSAKKKRRTKK